MYYQYFQKYPIIDDQNIFPEIGFFLLSVFKIFKLDIGLFKLDLSTFMNLLLPFPFIMPLTMASVR